MQVFVPFPDFQESVAVLDYRRLGKQRVECQQILTTLQSLRVHESAPGVVRGWANHPAVRMWHGYESALGVYMTMCVAEWSARGYVNNMVPPYSPTTFLRHDGLPDREMYAEDARDAGLPWWWGRDDVHKSHQRALLAKDPEWYRQFGWRVVPRIEYVWPTERPPENEVI